MTTTAPAITPLDEAVCAAIEEAGTSRNFAVVFAGCRRGFAAAKAVLDAVLAHAAKANDIALLRELNAVHYPGALAALQKAEHRRGLAVTPTPGTDTETFFARNDAFEQADKEFIGLARRIFIGDRTGLKRVAAAREFNDSLAAREQRRTEPDYISPAGSWAI